MDRAALRVFNDICCKQNSLQIPDDVRTRIDLLIKTKEENQKKGAQAHLECAREQLGMWRHGKNRIRGTSGQEAITKRFIEANHWSFSMLTEV